MAYLHVNGIDLYVEIRGEGTPLVALHGNGEDHSTFDVLGDALQETFTLYAFDTRGHGKSTMVEEYHYADMAEDIAQALMELFAEPVDVIGFSDGGVIAAGAAHDHLRGKLSPVWHQRGRTFGDAARI